MLGGKDDLAVVRDRGVTADLESTNWLGVFQRKIRNKQRFTFAIDNRSVISKPGPNGRVRLFRFDRVLLSATRIVEQADPLVLAHSRKRRKVSVLGKVR